MKRLVIGILAHVDSGKTTLSEALLYRAGALRKLGRVDHRDAFLDTDELERARGITIFSKQAVLSLPGAELTLLDTPGHVDFSAEAERTLQVLDCAVLVVSGTDGVQSHTETLWRLLERYHIPTLLFVNKMDLPGKGRDGILQELRQEPARERVQARQREPQGLWGRYIRAPEGRHTQEPHSYKERAPQTQLDGRLLRRLLLLQHHRLCR